MPSPSSNDDVDHYKYFIETCRSKSFRNNALLIVPTPMFEDNYSYLCFSPATNCVVAVDPADPKAVLQMIAYISKQSGIEFALSDILCTHKHWDHAGGNEEFLRLSDLRQRRNDVESAESLGLTTSDVLKLVNEDLRVIGSKTDQPAGTNVWVTEDDLTDHSSTKPLLVAKGSIPVRSIRSPGHTCGSLMFLVGAPISVSRVEEYAALFTGDCVFCGGCGAMFEVRNVSDVLATYDAFHNDFLVSSDPYTSGTIDPKNIHVYVGHEYSEKLYDELQQTAEKMKWSSESQRIISSEVERVKRLRKLRKNVVGGEEEVALPLCTVPSTLYVERRANPLLSVQRSALVELRRKEERNSRVASSDIEAVIYTSAAR